MNSFCQTQKQNSPYWKTYQPQQHWYLFKSKQGNRKNGQSHSQPTIAASPFIQGLKDQRLLHYLQNRNQKINKCSHEQLDDLLYRIQRCQQDLWARKKQSEENMETLLTDLQQFQNNTWNKNSSSAFGLSCNSRADHPLQTQPSQSQSKLQSSLKQLRLEERFSTLAMQFGERTNELKQEEKKLLEKLKEAQNQNEKEQKQRRQAYMKLIVQSQSGLEQICNDVDELNRRTDEAFFNLQESISRAEHQMSGCIQRQQETRRRDSRIIEGLIEKMIYKMTYL